MTRNYNINRVIVMAIKSPKKKGYRGEALCVEKLKEWGLKNPKRGANQGGGATEADVICDSLDAFWIEVKNREAGRCIYKYLEQAEKDTLNSSKIPIVLYKANNKKFLIIADAEYILPILCNHT